MCVLSDRWVPENIEFVNTQVSPHSSVCLSDLSPLDSGLWSVGWSQMVPGSEMKKHFSNPNIKQIKVIKRVKMPPKAAASSGLRGGINHIITEFFQVGWLAGLLLFRESLWAHCSLENLFLSLFPLEEHCQL
jgi:hypothetical protein